MNQLFNHLFDSEFISKVSHKIWNLSPRSDRKFLRSANFSFSWRMARFEVFLWAAIKYLVFYFLDFLCCHKNTFVLIFVPFTILHMSDVCTYLYVCMFVYVCVCMLLCMSVYVSAYRRLDYLMQVTVVFFCDPNVMIS